MAGFSNDTMFADNVDFSGGKSPTVTLNGQLLIGSTVAPNIRVGNLTSAGGTIAITNGAGTINLDTVAVPLVWTDIAIATLATPFSGWFATAALTLTLPAGAVQGDLVILEADTAGAVVIAANAGQFLQVAGLTSIVAGTATTTSIGDSLTFVFRAATSTWAATSVVGNWNIV